MQKSEAEWIVEQVVGNLVRAVEVKQAEEKDQARRQAEAAQLGELAALRIAERKAMRKAAK